jgi:hypothetical protein
LKRAGIAISPTVHQESHGQAIAVEGRQMQRGQTIVIEAIGVGIEDEQELFA